MKIILDFSGAWVFFNSNFFVALATLVTGGFLFVVYKLQKRDEKTKAAKIILSEIRNAEFKLKLVKKRISGTTYEDFPLVLPANSWQKFSYLFAKDFDQDELDIINNFFSNCQSIDEMASKDNNFFWITAEERARVVQQQLPQFILASYDNSTNTVDQHKLDTLKQSLLTTISNDPYSYTPQKTVNAIKLILEDVKSITNTPIGKRFKKIASR